MCVIQNDKEQMLTSQLEITMVSMKLQQNNSNYYYNNNNYYYYFGCNMYH